MGFAPSITNYYSLIETLVYIYDICHTVFFSSPIKYSLHADSYLLYKH